MKSFFWIDLEMTGLDEHTDSIVEVAVIVTDLDFNVLEEYDQVVYQSPEIVEGMNDWSQKAHTESGLINKIKDGKQLYDVEQDLLKLAAKYFSDKERVPLCGNSVGNDKKFVDKYMPELAKKLHYRVIDVSSFKEVFKHKYKIKINKKGTHRALDDIRESINELKTYLDYVSIPANKK